MAQRLGRFVKSEKAKREATSLAPKEVERLLAVAKEGSTLRDDALVFTALRAEVARVNWRVWSGATFNLVEAKMIRIGTYLCSAVTTDAGHAGCSHRRAINRAGST